MQADSDIYQTFIARTDALAQRMKVGIEDVPPLLGISRAMFYGYRGGKYPISRKAWGKLEAAEESAGIRVAEQPSKPAIPDWWHTLPPPERWERIRKTTPHVYERLFVAALRTAAGDDLVNLGGERAPNQARAFTDAINELGIPGTGLAATSEFTTLINAYTHALHVVRSRPLQERLTAQELESVRTKSALDEVLQHLKRLTRPAATAKEVAKAQEGIDRARLLLEEEERRRLRGIDDDSTRATGA